MADDQPTGDTGRFRDYGRTRLQAALDAAIDDEETL
jgi:hypothetical protein